MKISTKTYKIIYFISTAILCCFMIYSGLIDTLSNPNIIQAFADLGYPSYFPRMLGIANLLGVIAIVYRRYYLLKEWAYAGFTFSLISACYSHYSVTGLNSKLITPLFLIIILSISLFSSRKIVSTS